MKTKQETTLGFHMLTVSTWLNTSSMCVAPVPLSDYTVVLLCVSIVKPHERLVSVDRCLNCLVLQITISLVLEDATEHEGQPDNEETRNSHDVLNLK